MNTLESSKAPEFQTFSEWLRYHRQAERYSMRSLGDAAGVSGTYISTLEGNNDAPDEMSPRPSLSVVENIARVLRADVNVGKALAGWRSAEPPRREMEPPENFADWPTELQEALSFTRDLTPEVQVYIYQLWREQARAHANIEYRRREAERQLNEREERLKRERATGQ